MINEYDHVRIKSSGISGVVVDIRNNGDKRFTVESDERGVFGGYGDDTSFKLFDCDIEDLEKI